MNVALRPERLDILSICTGGGGLDLGVGLAVHGARTVCMVEREAFAVAQLVSAMEQGLLDQAPVWSDARTFDGRAWRGCVDGLIGGIPCQPHSLAGKRLADEDERDLWSIARRIIVQSGAWFVLIENVRGMLSSGGAERVWRDLRRLGFEVEPGLFAAAEVGASHERERIFLLAVADARRAERGEIALGRRVADGHEAGRDEGAGRVAKPSEDVADDAFQRWSDGSTPRRCDGPARASGGCGRDVADTRNPRLQGREFSGSSGERDRQEAPRSAPELRGASLVDAPRIGRREGRAEPELQSGRRATAGAVSAVGNTAGAGSLSTAQRGVHRGQEGRGARDGEPERSGGALFPPRPDDLSGWRDTLERAPELEPAFRRVADGLASRLDTARVDRLRMLGNGVVPLQAAYALRTLATRLADRGSAGADQLVRMMEAA